MTFHCNICKVDAGRCNKGCPANSGQKCGGDGVITVLLAECEVGWKRFGAKCFKELTNTDGVEWRESIQECAKVNE